MGREALEAAIANFRGEPVQKKEEGRSSAKCFDVTEEKIRKVAIENHLTTLRRSQISPRPAGLRRMYSHIEAILRRSVPEPSKNRQSRRS